MTFVIGHDGGENDKLLSQRSRSIGAETCAKKWGRDNRFPYLRAGSGIHKKHGAGTTNAGVHQSLRPAVADAFYICHGLNVERLPMDPIFYYNQFVDQVTIYLSLCYNTYGIT